MFGVIIHRFPKEMVMAPSLTEFREYLNDALCPVVEF